MSLEYQVKKVNLFHNQIIKYHTVKRKRRIIVNKNIINIIINNIINNIHYKNEFKVIIQLHVHIY